MLPLELSPNSGHKRLLIVGLLCSEALHTSPLSEAGWGLTSSSDGIGELYPEGEVPENEELYLTDSGTKLYKVEYDGKNFVLKKKV